MLLRFCNINFFLSKTFLNKNFTSFQCNIKQIIQKNQLTKSKKKKLFNTFKLFTLFVGNSSFIVRKAFCKNQKVQYDNINVKAEKCYLSFKDFWKLIKPYFYWLIIALLAAFGCAILNMQIPLLLGKMVNIIAEFLTKNSVPNFTKLKPIGGQLLVLYIAQAFLTFLYITSLSLMGEKIASDLRIKLFGHLLHFDMTFFDKKMSGELSDCLNFDVQEFKSCFKACVAQGLRTFTQTVGCVVSLYLMSPKMTIITISVIPVIILAGTLVGRTLRQLSNLAQSQSAYAMAIASEAFSNIRTVKEFAMEEAEQNLYKKQVENSKIINEKLGIGIGIFQAATNIFLNGIVLGILYGGARLIVDRNISPGDLMSFLVTTQTIQKSLSQLSLVFGNAVKGYTACARIHEFLNLKPSNVTGTLSIELENLKGNLKFDNVSFAYPNRPEQQIITNLSLEIKSGNTIALCGPSGSGKSTIASLIERLYEPQAGQILIDGIDLSQIDPYWLRKHAIGVISQEPILFATSIEENIRFGKITATNEEIKEVAKIANAHSFIENFPNGYKTLVGERGVALSGGQKQRIAIARAILKNPPILILDEATSALDAESEKLVQDALEKISKCRTVIVIAHRLSTIQNANLICVIQKGKLIEQGNHKELLKKKGAYYKLISLQQNYH